MTQSSTTFQPVPRPFFSPVTRSPFPTGCDAAIMPILTPPAPRSVIALRSMRFDTHPSRSHTPYSPTLHTLHPRRTILCAPSARTAADVPAAAWLAGHSPGHAVVTSPTKPLGIPLYPIKPIRRGESEHSKDTFSNVTSCTKRSFSASPFTSRRFTSPGSGYWKRVPSIVSPGRGM